MSREGLFLPARPLREALAGRSIRSVADLAGLDEGNLRRALDGDWIGLRLADRVLIALDEPMPNVYPDEIPIYTRRPGTRGMTARA